MKKLPITVIVPVKNEELNLKGMLPLLKDFDEVVVVDSQSTDRTIQVVSDAGYRLVQFHWDGHFPKKRNWVLRNVSLRNEWVFFVDADEFMTDEFLRDLYKAFENTGDKVGYWIYYNNYFMGKKLSHGDPICKLALFKKSAGEYERVDAENDGRNWGYSGIELHEQPQLAGNLGVIKGRIDHKENRSLESYIKKHNEFSTWEANNYLRRRKDTKPASFRQAFKYRLLDSWWLGRFYFLYIYFVRLGILDGKTGYIYAQLKKQYFFNIKLKIEEAKKYNRLK